MMIRLEKRLLTIMDKYLPVLVACVFAVMGVSMRRALMDFVSADSKFFLLPWYDQIKIHGLHQPVGNYNFLYQLLIFGMTKLPTEPLHAYKLLSAFFDYAMAIGVCLLVFHVSNNLWKSVVAFGAVILSPIVALNSTAWAQCDAIFCCFCVFALLALAKERYWLAMVLLGISFSCKLQAVFLLPFFLFYYYKERRFSLLLFVLVPVTMIATGLPALFFGRSPMDVFTVYKEQARTYESMSMNYPSLWLLMTQSDSAEQYTLLKQFAMVLTVGILAILMIHWIQKKMCVSGCNMLIVAFLLTYTCVLFLPAMHERYGYLYETLAIAVAVLLPKTAPLCAALVGISLCTYGSYLFKADTLSMVTLTVVNLLVYGGYVWYLQRQIQSEK